MPIKYTLKEFFKIFLLAIIPIVLISYMIQTEISFSGVLAIVAYFQFLLIWAQAEIGLRQHALFASQFDPFFQITSSTTPGSVPTSLYVTVKNTSNNPAYHVFASRILDSDYQPIMPKIWEDKLQDGPMDAEGAYSFSIDAEFIEGKNIEISFVNKLGDFKHLVLRIRHLNILMLPPRIQEPGVLLNTFRELSFFPNYLKLELKDEIQKIRKK